MILNLAERPLSTIDIFLFAAFVPLWPLIGISMRAYHPHSVGRGLSVTITDEFATVFRVSTMWSWFLILARSLATTEPIQLLPSLLVWGALHPGGSDLAQPAPAGRAQARLVSPARPGDRPDEGRRPDHHPNSPPS